MEYMVFHLYKETYNIRSPSEQLQFPVKEANFHQCK
jgi:hypothetical protein